MSTARGQSETIGAILLVAITVIAVSIVAGALFAANTPSDHPNARIEATANGTNLSVEHRAGQPIDEDEFEIVLRETSRTMAGTVGEPDDTLSDDDAVFEPGEVWVFDAEYSIAEGETVLLIYTSGDRVLLDETIVGLEPTATATTSGTSEPTTATSTVTETTAEPNQPPVADAGGNYTVAKQETVELNGTGSYDPDGTVESYSWEIVTEGNNVGSLTAADTATPTYEAPNGNVAGGVEVRLTVSDDDGAIATDTATIFIE